MVRRVAIIGANGFLGKYLVSSFHLFGYDVVAVYNSNFSASQTEGITWISWSNFLKGVGELDTIVYAASIIPYGKMDEKNDVMMRVNALQVNEIHQLHPDVFFVYISTVSIYASSQHSIQETSAWYPQNRYAATKLTGELLSRRFERNAILRCSSIYGKGMKPSTFIPRCIAQAKEEKVVVLYGDGSRRQNYVHASDVAQMCVLIADGLKCGEYLAVSSESIDNLSIASAIAETLSAKITFTGQDLSSSFYYDGTKTYSALNYVPRENCLATIKEMCHEE